MTATSWDQLAAEAKAAPQEFVRDRLRKEFGVPPFSILDTRQGDWQDRRRGWLSLGIQSELGRGEAGMGSNPAASGDMSPAALRQSRGTAQRHKAKADARSFGVDLMRGEHSDKYTYSAGNGQDGGAAPGTSIFDPVLCELAYRWWAPAGGTVLDPFAGGSVRGIVAAWLGHPYTGVDLSGRQLEANRQQAATILADGQPTPQWVEGDSLAVLPTMTDQCDLVFTCPPYYDLEVYSDDPRDLSTMATLADFADAYTHILGLSVHRLRQDRFAVVVVGEVRDKSGRLQSLVPLTINAMEQAGARYYNDGILVNSAGSLPIRTMGQFTAKTNGRKLGRMHQYVLVFVKGNPPTGEWDYQRPVEGPRPQLTLALDAGTPEVPTDPSPTAYPPPGGGGGSTPPDTAAPTDAAQPSVDRTAVPVLPVPPAPMEGTTGDPDDDDLPEAIPRATAAAVPPGRPTIEAMVADDTWDAAMAAILTKWAEPVVSIDRASRDEDMHQATDYVLTTAKRTVAARVRGGWGRTSPPPRIERDLTIRVRSAGGGETELAKLKAGYGDLYLYAWCHDRSGTFDDWVLVDLHRMRKVDAWRWGCAPIDNHDGTYFTGIPLAPLADTSCIVASSRSAREVAVGHRQGWQGPTRKEVDP